MRDHAKPIYDRSSCGWGFDLERFVPRCARGAQLKSFQPGNCVKRLPLHSHVVTDCGFYGDFLEF